VKALSLWQPWASLMADERKKIETRSWRPPVWLLNQPVAIHATMKVDSDACEDCG
jgi:activating signal cointegrator 1